jgi:hypothetical protein
LCIDKTIHNFPRASAYISRVYRDRKRGKKTGLKRARVLFNYKSKIKANPFELFLGVWHGLHTSAP